MAITAILDPGMSDDEFLSQFNHETRFCMINDHYNTPPIPPYGRMPAIGIPLVEQLMQHEKNIIFLTQVWHEGLNDLDNVYYYNPVWLYINHRLQSSEIDITKIGECSIANVIGIATRCNRILASHWLAKNFPVHEILKNWKNNDSLVPIKKIIENSKYYKRQHLRRNKFLLENYYDNQHSAIQNAVHLQEGDYLRFHIHNLPNLFRKSMLTILTDTGHQEMSNSLSEKTLFALASGCLILPVGVYQCNHVLKRMGFNTFENVFDMTHLDNKDMYAMTVMGFENNKSIITSKDQVEHLWNLHKKEIQFNHDLACKTHAIKDFFSEALKHAKEACRHGTNITNPQFRLAHGVV